MNSDTVDKRKRVLIVDDEPDLVRTIGLRLQRAGYEVLMAPDAVTATQVAIAQRPDAIVLDIGLPGGDGHVVAKRLKGNVRTSGIPVIFVTARAGRADVTKAQEVGAFGYLVKPYEPAALLDLVKLATGGRDFDEAEATLSAAGRMRRTPPPS